MKARNGLTLAAAIAVMLGVVLAFAPGPRERAMYRADPAPQSGVVRVNGQALIDLNAADAALLSELPGIGAVLAGRIVLEREQGGLFDSAAALTRVSGIAEGKMAALLPRVTACP